jgi:hypothetical protein
MDFNETEQVSLDWINLARKLRSLVNTIMNLRVPETEGTFFFFD